MPYKSREELPESIKKKLPAHAQDIYRKAFNSAAEEYADPKKRRGGNKETTAHRVAWAAVKKKYEKGADEKWHRFKK